MKKIIPTRNEQIVRDHTSNMTPLTDFIETISLLIRTLENHRPQFCRHRSHADTEIIIALGDIARANLRLRRLTDEIPCHPEILILDRHYVTGTA